MARSLLAACSVQCGSIRRLLLAGDEDAVTTTDLLALVLGSTAAARSLLARYGSLGSIEEAEVADLLCLEDVGARRATTLRAALALARRRASEPPFRGRKVTCSRDVFDLLGPLLRHERREVLVALALDARNRLVRSPVTVAIGSLTRAAVEPRELLRPLIVAAAASAVLAHNHPSSCVEPSPEDIELSRQIARATGLVGIRLLDHVIVADGTYASLADRGLL